MLKKQNNKSIETPYRIDLLDFIRGIAIGLMFIFHISFGLSEMGLLNVSFSTSFFWIAFRGVIVFLFLSLVGIGLTIKNTNNPSFKFKTLFNKRLLLLFNYMLLISLFSYFVRPHSFVYFGILHLIFVSSILGYFLVNANYILLATIATIFLLVGLTVESEYLNSPVVYWLGLGDQRPQTDDFAPLFPWFSLVVFGIILGKKYFKTRLKKYSILKWKPDYWLTKLICWGGRYSIHIYFFHFQLFYLLVLIFN